MMVWQLLNKLPQFILTLLIFSAPSLHGLENDPAGEGPIQEQWALDIERQDSFGIILSSFLAPQGTKIYRLGLIQGKTSIETSNLTMSEYDYFKKGVEHTLLQDKVLEFEGECGHKLRLRFTNNESQKIYCYKTDPQVLVGVHEWVAMAREFIWMKKSQGNKKAYMNNLNNSHQ